MQWALLPRIQHIAATLKRQRTAIYRKVRIEGLLQRTRHTLDWLLQVVDENEASFRDAIMYASSFQSFPLNVKCHKKVTAPLGKRNTLTPALTHPTSRITPPTLEPWNLGSDDSPANIIFTCFRKNQHSSNFNISIRTEPLSASATSERAH